MRDVRFNQCLRAFGLGVKREDQTHHKHGDYVLGFAALISLAIFKFYWISDNWIKNLAECAFKIYLNFQNLEKETKE